MKWLMERIAKICAIGLAATLAVGVLPTFFSPDGALAAAAHQGAVQVQGRQRTFTVITPDRFDKSRQYPIVLLLHGGQGDGSKIAEQSQLGRYVSQAGIIAVFPDAGGEEWNDGRRSTRTDTDDVQFVRAVIKAVAREWNGDPDRVLVAGASNGGMMAQRVACEAQDLFTAVGAVVANMPADLVGQCHPSGPVSIILFSGTKDRLMPWRGGDIPSSRAFGGAGGQVISAMETFQFWSQHNRCDGKRTEDLPDIARDGTRVKLFEATNCQSGADVLLYAIDGGGHTWPGGEAPQRRLARRLLGDMTQDISASAMLIDFLNQHSR